MRKIDLNNIVDNNDSLDSPQNIQAELNQTENVMSFFQSIKDNNDPSLTLYELAFSESTEGLYHMNCNNKKYEIHIQPLNFLSSKEKIILIKDQSTYENLVLEKLVGQYQKMLITSISHEIRNPLHSAQGFLSLIETEQKIETIKNHAKSLEGQLYRINLLLSGTSDLMLNDKKEIYIEPRCFQIRDSITELLHNFSYDFHFKGLSVRINYSSLVPDKIYSVEEKFKIIMFHLISNAIKYTERGEIRINVDYQPILKQLTVVVSDTGRGISKESLVEIFTLYSHIGSANPYNPQGMGLGLTLCKHLCSILGGSISAFSIPGQGTKFEFSIKNFIDQVDHSLEIEVENVRGKSTVEVKIVTYPNTDNSLLKEDTMVKIICHCSQVLIVDDEPCNRMVLKSYLGSTGISVDEAENGKEAIEKIKQRAKSDCCSKYKIICMDINMPVMDGTESTATLLEIYKANPLLKTPIIAVTAASPQSRRDIKALLSVGFHKILQKPVSKKQFQEVVSPLL